MKKKYPAWFSPYAKPYLRAEPIKPTEEIHSERLVHTLYEYEGDMLKNDIVNLNFDIMRVTYSKYDDDSQNHVEFIKKETNIKGRALFTKEMKRYEKDHAKWLSEKTEHEEKLKLWVEFDREIKNAAAADKQEKEDLATYKKLKTKFEKAND